MSARLCQIFIIAQDSTANSRGILRQCTMCKLHRRWLRDS